MAYTRAQAEKKKETAPETFAIPGSSFLQAATYDATNFSLTLDFKNGSQIVHRYVFPMVWQQFKESHSHGSYFSRNIKRKYPSVNFRKPMKVSDMSKAMNEYRRHK